MGADQRVAPNANALGERVRLAMRGTASGVAIVTTAGAAGLAGITVSSFGSLSLDPPSVLVCVKGDSRTLAVVLANGFFAANVLAEDQAPLAEIFAGPADSGSRFASARWSELVTGSPILCGAVASFDCKLAKTFEHASHTIVVGDVLDVGHRPAPPLLYHARTYGRFDL